MTDFEYIARIYCQVFDLRAVDCDIYAPGVQSSIATLTKREQHALELHYRQDFSYVAVGAAFGVSRAYAGAIVKTAMRKLRHPSRTQEMRASTVVGELQAELVAKEATVRLLNDLVEDLLAGKQLAEKALAARSDETLHIGILQLSTRTFNSLIAREIETIDDILAIVDNRRLMAIRNFGLVSRDELVAKMRAHGYDAWAAKMEMTAGSASAGTPKL